jgi:hypothetical protein
MTFIAYGMNSMMKTDAEFAASFDFIYFTEGDQVLVGRQFPQIFSYLRTNPYSVNSIK